jgi:multicomponent Na+:H+ antiporter subunit D
MDALPPLPVAIPLFTAAFLAGAGLFLRRRMVDVLSLAAAVAVTVICVVLLVRATGGTIVHWFGGWTPRRGVALGISFVVDPVGAAMAAFSALLVVAGLLFSWRYFEVVRGALFHSLMLVFLAAMAGFALTGDLFNMFVFFELMSVAAYALTAYRIEERGPLQGALNFAVVNTVGGFMILMGTAMLYGRTGALNLAQVGEALAGRPADGLVIVSFTLLAGGFLIKAAAVPFHFWLGDAYAVAPTPVGVVFAGALSELGLLGLARVYWTGFAGVLDGGALRDVLLVIGAVTAVVGSVMAFEQRHLKRMLAFVTVGHSGLILVGLSLLDPSGTAGAWIYLVADGMVKAALFVGMGILKHRLGRLDEDAIRGRGKRLPYSGTAIVIGGLALAGLPPFGTALGKSLMEHAAEQAHLGWVPILFGFTAVVTGGTVLRAAGRVFLGWGPKEAGETPSEVEEREERRETRGARGRTPPTMVASAGLLLAGALAVGLWPAVGPQAEEASARFHDRPAYAAAVLEGRGEAPEHEPSGEGISVGSGVLFAVGAVALGGAALFRRRLLPRRVRRATMASVRPAVNALRFVHSGEVQDYVAWVTLGVAALGGAFALGLG